MKTILLAAAALVTIGGAAQAADMPVPAGIARRQFRQCIHPQ
jgi:hypothetical protein